MRAGVAPNERIEYIQVYKPQNRTLSATVLHFKSDRGWLAAGTVRAGSSVPAEGDPAMQVQVPAN